MDITKLNEEYKKEKSYLDKLNAPGGLKDRIDQFQAQINEAYRDFKVAEANLEFATIKNDQALIDQYTQEKKDIQDKIGKIKVNLEKAKHFLAKQQAKVDEKIEALSRDPEIKKKLDTILFKKYDRKKAKALKDLEALKAIKAIIDQHPNLQKTLKGMENAMQQLKTADGIIKKFSGKTNLTPGEQKQLAKAQQDQVNSSLKYTNLQNGFENFFKKNHPEIDINKVLSISSYSNLQRQISGAERDIANCDKAMDGLSVAQEFGNNRISSQRDSAPAQPSVPAVAPAKPSWLHPIKRIKYAINERRNSQQADPQQQQGTNPYSRDFKESVRLTKDEYEAEIVKEYLKKEQEGLHKAAVENRKRSDSEGR